MSVCRTTLKSYPLDVYNLDSTCHEMSKYLNGEALGIVVSEDNIFEI